MAATAANPSTQVSPARPGREWASAAADRPPVWAVAVVPELRHAEELLDHLEAHGFREMELLALDGSSFVVRWR